MYQKDYEYNSIESILNQNSKVSGLLQFLLLQQREVDFIYIYIYIFRIFYCLVCICYCIVYTVQYTHDFPKHFSKFFFGKGIKIKIFSS